MYYACVWLFLSDQRERWQKRTCPPSSSPKGKGPSFLSGNWWTNWRLKRRTINEISQKAEIRKLLKKLQHLPRVAIKWPLEESKQKSGLVRLARVLLIIDSWQLSYCILYLLSFLLLHHIHIMQYINNVHYHVCPENYVIRLRNRKKRKMERWRLRMNTLGHDFVAVFSFSETKPKA